LVSKFVPLAIYSNTNLETNLEIILVINNF